MPIEDELATRGASLAAAINAQDAAGAAAHYTADAQLLPPGAPLQSGRSAIEAYWAGAIEAGLSEVRLKSTEVLAYGEEATELGVVTGAMGGAALVGKFVVLWKRDAGLWKLRRDIWNFDA